MLILNFQADKLAYYQVHYEKKMSETVEDRRTDESWAAIKFHLFHWGNEKKKHSFSFPTRVSNKSYFS
jgi:hypothetical protein